MRPVHQGSVGMNQPQPQRQGSTGPLAASCGYGIPSAPSRPCQQQAMMAAPRASSNGPSPGLRAQVLRPRPVLQATPSTLTAQDSAVVPSRGWTQQSPVSQTYQAADSEDMERRSINGSSEIARAAFDRDLKLVQGKVQAVSLGGSCGPKISLRRLGLGEATMPFDWMRTRVQGLIHWLRDGFDDFFAAQQRLEVTLQETSLTVYRSPTHSFWHDDIEDEACREKLRRRIDRFLGSADTEGPGSSRPLLFVRGIAGSTELEHTEELFEALRQRFEVSGRKVWLLLVLEDQPILGPVMHSTYEELILWVQPRFEGKVSTDVSVPAPYEDAIAFTVRHILGDRGGLYPGEPSEQWPMVDQASEILALGGTFYNAGCRESEVGLWVGNVRLKGSSREVLMSAFQGVDKLEGSTPSAPRPTPPAPEGASSATGCAQAVSSQGISTATASTTATSSFGSAQWARDLTPSGRGLGASPSMPVVAY